MEQQQSKKAKIVACITAIIVPLIVGGVSSFISFDAMSLLLNFI